MLKQKQNHNFYYKPAQATKTNIMSFLGNIFHWIGAQIASIFTSIKKELLQAAIEVTKELNTIVNSPIEQALVKLLPGTLPTKIQTVLQTELPKILVKELDIQGITEATTEDELKAAIDKAIQDFATSASAAERARIYTSVAAQVYIILQDLLEGKTVTFGEAATLVESAYQTWVLGNTAPEETEAKGTVEEVAQTTEEAVQQEVVAPVVDEAAEGDVKEADAPKE